MNEEAITGSLILGIIDFRVEVSACVLIRQGENRSMQISTFNKAQGEGKEKCAKRMEEIQNLLKNNIIRGEVNLIVCDNRI
ncbi:21509_t:CDS:2 [Entrophospora sp. SA101]|nr:21509_t:CDS:2 [Entrophospora sp. SA101]CAJ0826328.1 9320_t:CDS:2 [Entrophospora sp. SA101]CAJ0826333.1 9322_t:CDS:2 [Entrophospora sp. SA101]